MFAVDAPVHQHLSEREWSQIDRCLTVPDADLCFGQIAPLPRFEAKTPGGGRMVAEGKTVWLAAALKAVLDLLTLPPNWNSYGALPVGATEIHATIEILRWVLPPDGVLPHFVPTARGRVQLEWHRRGIDLEIEVMGPDRSDVYYENANTGETWEGEVSFDLGRLKQFVGEAAKP